MELEQLRSYLDKEVIENEQHSKEKEHMFEKQAYQIEEIDNKIKTIKDNFDFAYEAFSPISQKQEKMQAEIEELEQQKKQLLQSQENLKSQMVHLEDKREEISQALQELSSEKSSNEKRLKSIKENYSRIFGIKIIERQEEERQRIARDLHDTMVQNLTAMIHKLEFCQQVMDSDPIRAKLEMQLVMNSIRESVNGMREVIYNLRPMSFDDIGFKETLLRAVDRLRKNTDIKIGFTVEGDIYPMNPAYELTILRIIQEATNNSKKYSQAENIEIVLSYEEERITLTISDNGTGFDVLEKKSGHQNSGFGISMMKERVYLLKGQIDIISQKNEGTRIEVILPRKKLEGEGTDED